jgi:dodecin
MRFPHPLSGVRIAYVWSRSSLRSLWALFRRASGAARRSRNGGTETTANLICLRRMRANSGSMSDHIYKKLELVGSSATSIEDAVMNALTRAQKTIRNMRWFEVVETRGHIEDGKINEWQVTVKVGFTLDK